jgi:hypothetical protein
MADFCRQCANELGLPENDFVFITKKNGFYNTNLCENCGMINTNRHGECVASPDCKFPVGQDIQATFITKNPNFTFGKVPKVNIGSQCEYSHTMLEDYYEIDSINDIDHIHGYKVYLCDEGVCNLYALNTNNLDYLQYMYKYLESKITSDFTIEFKTNNGKKCFTFNLDTLFSAVIKNVNSPLLLNIPTWNLAKVSFNSKNIITNIQDEIVENEIHFTSLDNFKLINGDQVLSTHIGDILQLGITTYLIDLVNNGNQASNLVEGYTQ